MSKNLFLDRLSRLSSESDLELFNQLGKALEEMETDTAKKLQALYARVDRELSTGLEQFVLYGAVVDPGQAALYRSFLPPVPAEPDPGALATEFFALDEPALSRLEGLVFPAVVKTKGGTYTIRVRAARSRQFQGQLLRLRREFFSNSLPWRHVCFPGLFQFISFFPCEAPPWEEDPLLCVELELSEWEEFRRAGVLAVWNLEPVRLPCMMSPMPALDHVNFEHALYLEDEDCGYLVLENQEIKYVARSEREITVFTRFEEAALWDALKFIPVPRRALLPETISLFSNEQTLSHTDKQAARAIQFIQTKAHIRRLFESYSAAKGFILLDVSTTLQEDEDSPALVTSQRAGGFFPEDFPRRERMVFHVSEKGETAFPRLVLSFIMAELESRLPQYRCEALLSAAPGGEEA